jgi:hypothetical protein
MQSGESFALRPGVAMPDWSLVPDTAGRTALAASMAVAGRRQRWSGLDAAEDALWQAVLRGFIANGQPPGPAGLAAASGLAEEALPARLQSLRDRDLLVLDAAGRITAAYPFSTLPTPHRVTLQGAARPVHALCAIDALGAGGMAGRDSTIESTCAECGTRIRIITRGHGLAATSPRDAVVWSGIRYAGGCAASSGCALKLFFCSDRHLDAWRARQDPDGPGYRLPVAVAQQVGLALFVPMLRQSG